MYDERGDEVALLEHQCIELGAKLRVARREHARLGPVHEAFIAAVELPIHLAHALLELLDL